jgi:hypothetical protein
VATSNTGGWVRRVGSSGGGRTYRKRRPFNFYGVVVVVVVLGFASIAWARYEYNHPAAAASSIAPTVSDNWYEALGLNACGHQLPALPANSSAIVTGYGAVKGGVIDVQPKATSESGTKSNLSLFVDSYTGLTVSKSSLIVPVARTTKEGKASSLTYTTGTVCPKGTPDAGKKGAVEIATWPDVSSTTPHLYTSPSAVRFTAASMLITIAFEPAGAVPPKPPASAIALALAGPPQSTTTTTAPVTSTTSGATTTTQP